MRWWLVFGACVACAGGPRPTYTTTFTDRAIRVESYAKAFRSAEPGLISGLAFDTRIFARTIPKPTAAQLSDRGTLGFGAGAWVSRGFADPFMFTDREAALERERESFERVAADAALQAEWAGSRITESHTPEPLLVQLRLEQFSMRRMLDAEDARLERERTLPKGAADLLRAMVLGWPVSPHPGAMHDLESALAWRFSNVEESLAPNTLSAAERDDLRDVLTELAPRVAPMPRAAAAMVKLRTTLDAMWVTPFPNEDEHELDKELTLYVGSPVSFDALDGAFESAQRAFAGQVDAGLSVLDAAGRARVAARAMEIFFRAPACAPRVPVHSVLDMGPPDERTWSCALVHALDDSKTDEDEIAADLAFNDAITVARWAVATHGPVRSTDAAMARAPMRSSISASERTRMMRLAQARPWRAIAVGVAASILTKTGAGRARVRSHKWRGIGDAPMDLVDEALFVQR